MNELNDQRNQMDNNELLIALKRLSINTGSIACLGCGHEHNCGIHGCALIRDAICELEQAQIILESYRQIIDGLRYQLNAQWISVKDRLLDVCQSVLTRFEQN